MSSRPIVSRVLALAFVLIATAALAFTVAELETRATAMQADYTDLHGRVQTATTQQRAGLEAEYQARESERSTLIADRATLGTCSCSTLDQQLAGLASDSDSIQVIIDSWDPI